MNEVKMYVGQSVVLAAANEDGCIMQTFSWENGTMSESNSHEVGVTVSNSSAVPKRMYLNFTMPTLPCNPRIKKAELKFNVSAINKPEAVAPVIGLFRVTEAIATGTASPAFDADSMDYAVLQTSGECVLDVTKIVDMVNKGESTNQNLMLKLMGEDLSETVCATIGGVSNANPPSLTITYETNYGVNTNYRANTHDIGRFGQGSIDLTSGNLMFESLDFAWGGNRMPVTLKHLYNSSLCNHRYTGNSAIKLHAGDFSAMNLGLGWRLNIMQSMVAASFQHEGEICNGYVYVGENGEETYFKQSTETKSLDDGTAYNLYETIDDSELFYDPIERTMDLGGHSHLFDASGRLVKITDQHNNSMDIIYADGKITYVRDGAEHDGKGREFAFVYTDDLLTSITAPDNSVVQYSYTSGKLTGISYPGNMNAEISYKANNLPSDVTVTDADNIPIYRVRYQYVNSQIAVVDEFGAEYYTEQDGNTQSTPVAGKCTCYEYSAARRRTLVRSGLLADSVLVDATAITDPTTSTDLDAGYITVYTYDDDGDVLSEYAYATPSNAAGVVGSGHGVGPYFESGVNTIAVSNNLLANHTFNGFASWTKDDVMAWGIVNDEAQAKYGQRAILMTYTPADGAETVVSKGISQIVSAPAGDLTFSAYLRLPQNITGGSKPGVYLLVANASGIIIAATERVSVSNNEYFRLDVPFSLETAQDISVNILMNGSGSVYVSAPQLETNNFASKYNLVTNGDFKIVANDASWTKTSGATCSTDDNFNLGSSLKIVGNIVATNGASQNIDIHSAESTRETYQLSGWAKGSGVADRERAGLENAKFTLKATVHYVESANQEPDVFEAPFNTAINDWQYMTLQFAKTKFAEVDHVEVSCNYDYSFGTVYFDDIQLVREYLETGLAEEDFADPMEEQTLESEEEEDVFEEAYDEFGNALTETIFSDNEEDGTLYRAFMYQNGNDLIAEMDNRGCVTRYEVNPDNSNVMRVIDRCDRQTMYVRDDAGRIIAVGQPYGSVVSEVQYAYDEFDNLSRIVRGDGMQYVLQYNQFHNLDAICVDNEDIPIVQYAYKDGNGRLKQVTYGNGDVMKVAYNNLGQMIAERWYNSDNNMTAYYRYSYDNNGNIVRSIDILAQKEYSYTYEEGRLMRAVECDVTLNENIVTARTLVNTILYTYDAEGTLTWKRIIPAAGAATVLRYNSNPNGKTTVQCSGDDFDFVSLAQTDSLGRKKYDELHINDTVLARQFAYYEGNITPEHEAHNKIKYAPTTQLVKTITLPDRTLTYFYDPEERITKVIDSLEGTTEYIYDYLGQLRRETHDGTVVNEMEYDKYGNITRKNRMPYAYDIDAWKDLMTYFAGQRIDYDGVGNPVLYCGKGMVWEKGRQLKEIVGENCNIGYTYNANGIRTSKTVNGVKHTYTLDGTKILREVWGNNELIPLYDVEDAPCGIVYNGTPYYFLKNLQGDIIAIVNANGETVARYRYDAWGRCLITSDTSNCNIATINPFRYRGYYYDEEIAMYYLQSRYYDPMVGRFINIDTPKVVGNSSDVLGCNLYTYCNNDPVNNTDISGAIIAQKIAEVFLSAIFGMIFQLFTDFALFLVAKFIGNKSTPFNPEPGDYVDAALEWAFDAIKLFPKKKKYIASFITSTIRAVVSQIAKYIAGFAFDLASMFKSVTVSAVVCAVHAFMNKTAYNKIKKLNKGILKGKKLKTAKLKIKAKYKILGETIEQCITIPTEVYGFVTDIIACL